MKIKYSGILPSIINPVNMNGKLNHRGKDSSFQQVRFGVRSLVSQNIGWQRQHTGNYVTDQMELPSMWIAL